MIDRSEQQLGGPFSEKAPAHVVEREREKVADLKLQRDQLQRRMADLS
jgi:hypothetical protein